MVDLAVGSYHPRSWCPLVKLMSVLWKMAAHWKGAFTRTLKVSYSASIKIGMMREAYPVHALTRRAVAVLGVQWLFATELILHGAAVAFSSPFDVKLVAVVVDLVGRAELPLVFFAGGRSAGLVLVWLVAVAALVVVLVFRHFGDDGGSGERSCGEV